MTEQTTEQASGHSASYEFEAEYTDGTTGTITIPRMSSATFFDIYTDPVIVKMMNVDADTAMLSMIRKLVEMILPGIFEKLTISSGLALIALVTDKEIRSLDLGEVKMPSETAEES